MTLESTEWSAIAAGLSAIAACMSLIVTCYGVSYQKKSLLDSQRNQLKNLLDLEAKRANQNTFEKPGMDWDFRQCVNITYAIDAARLHIIEACNDGVSNEEVAKSFFVNKLCYQVIAELRNDSPPDGFHIPNGTHENGIEAVKMWQDNRLYFDYT